VCEAVQPDLTDETIAAVFYVDAGLKRGQQLFADLNRTPSGLPSQLVSSTTSAIHCRALCATWSDAFRYSRTLQKISNRSTKLFTMSGIYQATGALLGKDKGKPIGPAEADAATGF
jgi:DNA sulfur modification protein DndB